MARRKLSEKSLHPGGETLMPVALGRALGVFDLIPTMEDVLARRWPGKVGEPRPMMLLLFPTVPVRASDALYRAHCDELVARVPERSIDTSVWRSLETLTRAEVVGLLSEASLRYPLAHHDALVYETLFRETMPSAALPNSGDVLGDATVREVLQTIAEWLSRVSPERVETIRQLRAEAA